MEEGEQCPRSPPLPPSWPHAKRWKSKQARFIRRKQTPYGFCTFQLYYSCCSPPHKLWCLLNCLVTSIYLDDPLFTSHPNDPPVLPQHCLTLLEFHFSYRCFFFIPFSIYLLLVAIAFPPPRPPLWSHLPVISICHWYVSPNAYHLSDICGLPPLTVCSPSGKGFSLKA